jgi:hypothetical protein
MWVDWVTEPWTAIFLHPQDRCGDKLITIGRRGRTCESRRVFLQRWIGARA